MVMIIVIIIIFIKLIMLFFTMWTYVCEQEIIFSNICLHFVKKFEEVITYLFFLIFHKSSLTNPLYSNFHDLTEGVSMRRGIPGLSDEKRQRRGEESAERRP